MPDIAATRRESTITHMTDLVEHHLRHCRAAGQAVTTIVFREKLLRRLDRELPMGLIEATTEELEDWLATNGGADRRWSDKTRSTYYEHISAFYRWAADPRRTVGLEYDPAAGLVRPRGRRGLPRPVTEDELAFAMAMLDEPWRTYVHLAAYAGLRCCEISALKRRDITQEAITVVRGKGGKGRSVPTDAGLWGALKDKPPGLIALTTRDRLPVPRNYVSETTSLRLTAIGLPDVTLHRFRHRFATILLRPVALGGAGADLRTVQELMGHSSPAVTAIYTLITDEQREMAIRALPALAPSPR